MSLSEVVVQGTLKPDGTLELDEKPGLAPGRVTVVLRQEAGVKSPRPLDEAFFRMMEEIWVGQRARGHVPRTEEEVETERRQLRQEMEGEVEAAIRLQEESRHLRRQAESGEETP
jgi:hypothetical protein